MGEVVRLPLRLPSWHGADTGPSVEQLRYTNACLRADLRTAKLAIRRAERRANVAIVLAVVGAVVSLSLAAGLLA